MTTKDVVITILKVLAVIVTGTLTIFLIINAPTFDHNAKLSIVMPMLAALSGTMWLCTILSVFHKN